MTVILSNLSCHAGYLRGSAHFLLTHIRSDEDLLGPHVEPDEAKKLSQRLSEAVSAARELEGELQQLQTLARNVSRIGRNFTMFNDVLTTLYHVIDPLP